MAYLISTSFGDGCEPIYRQAPKLETAYICNIVFLPFPERAEPMTRS